MKCLAMYSPGCYIGSDEIDQDLRNICLLVDSHRWHHLHLDNTTWLDTTWHLPTVVTHEFVPAADLGVAVVLVNGWPVVTSVQESSVAAEDDKVEVGGVITHINDVSVVGATTTEKMLGLINKGRRKPISMQVTKCFDNNKEELFPSIVPHLKSVGIDVEELQR